MKIGIQNFRVFKELEVFEIKPLTILLGPNNSGKSSFTKLLLLIQNGFDKLDFSKGVHNLEGFYEILSWDSEDEQLRLHFEGIVPLIPDAVVEIVFSEQGPTEVYIYGQENEVILGYRETRHEKSHHLESEYWAEWKLDFNAIVKYLRQKNLVFNGKSLEEIYREYAPKIKKIFSWAADESWINSPDDFNSLNLSNCDSALNKIESAFGNYDYEYDENWEIIESSSPKVPDVDKQYFYLVALYNELDELDPNEHIFRINKDGKDVSQDYLDLLERGLRIGSDWKEENFMSMAMDEGDFWNNLLMPFSQPELNLEYDIIRSIEDDHENHLKTELTRLGSILTSTLIPLTNGAAFLESIGSNLADHLNSTFENLLYIPANRGTTKRVLGLQGGSPLENAVSAIDVSEEEIRMFIQRAVEIFDIPGRVEIEKIENYVAIVWLVDERSNTKVNLADLGFGYSQLMPVILDIAYGGKNNIVIIEEPEANLHPKLQSRLADFFKFVLEERPLARLLIETHSEYLIRKLQYLVATERLSNEEVAIHYFNDEAEAKIDKRKVRHIYIHPNGTLNDTFGPGFYDEATRLKFDLMKINQEQQN